MEVRRHVDGDPARLWALVADLDNWGRMLPTFRRVTRLDGEGPVTVGSRFQVRQPGLAPAVYEITDWQPGRCFTWVSTAVGVRTEASHRIDAEEGGGSELVLGIAWSGALAGLVRRLLGAKVRRKVELEADTFARLAGREPTR